MSYSGAALYIQPKVTLVEAALDVVNPGQLPTAGTCMDLNPHYLLDMARGCYARALRCDDADARDSWIALGARYEAVYAGETVADLPASPEAPDGLFSRGPLLPVPG